MTDSESNIAAKSPESRPPAVLQVLPRLVTGGVERGTVEMAAALTAAGWRAVVASAGGPMVREVERAGATHVLLPLASKNPFVMRANIGRLVETIRRHRIDIVHARSRAPAWSAYAAAQRTNRHFVTTLHNAYGAQTWLKRRYNSVMVRGELVIAISEFVAEHAAATYGLPRVRLRVIRRGVDVSRFDPDRVSAERMIKLAGEWRLSDGAPVVMLPGRISRWKGHRVLIAAMKMLARPNVQCVMVGGGDARHRQELEAAALAAGVGSSFRIVDQCNDMPAAYMLADVVVSASTEPEGFGRIIVEAQAMGRPVIATAHGGARETVLPDVTGWLVAPGNPGALAAAIAAALDLGTEERLAMAERAMLHVRANYTTAQMTEQTLAVYEEILFPNPVALLNAPTGPVAA